MSVNVSTLSGNSPLVFLSSCNQILKYTTDIKQFPASSKFRKIPIDNSDFEKTLLFVPGAVDVLVEIGYSNVDHVEYFLLPLSRSLTDLHRVHQELSDYRTVILAHLSASNVSLPSWASTDHANLDQTSETRVIAEISDLFWNQTLQQIHRQSEIKFVTKLRSGYNTFKVYENMELQEKALSVIPRSALIKQAVSVINERSLGLDYIVDFFTIELLRWFKSFFKWVDPLPCAFCTGKTVTSGLLTPTPDELRFGAGRVENHQCTVCHASNRFPRYNDPGKLLETRTGRCGEFANCFTLCCVAAGLDARYVLDWTDHVWTEVYSKRQGRWLHCDPCENACDQPLLYSKGWKKELTYVVAFSSYDIQDVTWRYVFNYTDTRRRRKECREKQLNRLLLHLRKELRAGLPTIYRDALTQRSIYELVELHMPPVTTEELGGRTTGTLEWRLGRGELGTIGGNASFTSQTIIPTSDELGSKLISIRYSCVRDAYERGWNTEYSRVIPGWKNMVHDMKNLTIKVENDWNMTYIAMTDDCVKGGKSGSISWKVDLSSLRITIGYVKVMICSKTYADGEVHWSVHTDDIRVHIVPGELHKLMEFSGCSHVTLSAVLVAGSDRSIGWQHAQLFRQPLSDCDVYPLIFEVGINS